jgi:glycosyltransferase involved in cell wall biosynthesis
LARARNAQARITWFGFRNQSEIPAVLQGADVLLHASALDPWPYSVLEGAISGLALLLSDRVGSHPDWIQAAQAGVVFRCGDIEDLGRAIRVMAEDRPARAFFQEAAAREAGRYTESEFCRRFEEVAVTLAELSRDEQAR